MNSSPKDVVDELLSASTPAVVRPSPLDAKPELVAAIVHFLDLKQAGDERVNHLSFTWFYENKLRPRFNGPCRTVVTTYIRTRLRRSFTTGEPA